METVVYIITINSHNEAYIPRITTQEKYPFRICDVTLPQCRTGLVYDYVTLTSYDIYWANNMSLSKNTRS